jgi:hypothetical protein
VLVLLSFVLPVYIFGSQVSVLRLCLGSQVSVETHSHGSQVSVLRLCFGSQVSK